MEANYKMLDPAQATGEIQRFFGILVVNCTARFYNHRNCTRRYVSSGLYEPKIPSKAEESVGRTLVRAS
jgi:hypothetical protein